MSHAPLPFEGTVPDIPFLIGGSRTGSDSDEWIEVHSPGHKGTVLARVPRGNAVDADRAVAAARAAFPEWSGRHFNDRSRPLLAIADALQAAAEELAVLVSWETGNALRTQSRGEAMALAAITRYYAGVAGEFKGLTLPAGAGQLSYTQREPLGVVAAIIPWNSPLIIAIVKIVSAIVAGNTLVLKTAEDAPLAVLRLGEIVAEHLPAGVVNVVSGYGAEIGEALVQHPGVAKVSFTGSSAVGTHIAEAAGSRLAHYSLELGGKSPNIVFPDAVNDETLNGILGAMRFTRQGQSCTAGSRLLVHESVYDDVMNGLVDRVSALKVGDPLDEATDMGAIINKKQFDRVLSYMDEGNAQKGIQVPLRGEAVSPGGQEGFYLSPTIFGAVDNSWRIAQEEIFGPVLVAIPWKDREDAIRLANETHYGLAAYIWTQNLDDAVQTANRIDAGWIQVNQGGGQMLGQTYGGYKNSGIGRENSLEGTIEAFTQVKQINIKLG
ncbi:aldehyde dehydrogenase family protein [Microbacterium aerolatum]|uniref:Aldehyde dehydrogenase n=1 Tax=Microbacterium aerolatum TaxID=153731 RepID=A0A511AE19_9MICO|nr:aldehyde dehydrogenase family protein [Microbacterium aerolatum]GEK86410.1 aldehyde dehydrogenase [Microbacterium aerolatum]GGB22651.1 aldehyde dehydrogenase [Microbacterium aerolatum]